MEITKSQKIDKAQENKEIKSVLMRSIELKEEKVEESNKTIKALRKGLGLRGE